MFGFGINIEEWGEVRISTFSPSLSAQLLSSSLKVYVYIYFVVRIVFVKPSLSARET